MKNLKLLKSLITLLLTSIVLITSVFAWYVENNSTSANGIQGTTKKIEQVGGTLKRYIAAKHKDDDGNIDYYSLGTDIDEFNVTPDSYDPLYDYDLIIYQLDFEPKSSSYKLTLSNNDSNISNTITINNNNGYNYLSNVATFKLLTTSDSGKTFTTTKFYDNEETKEIGYISDREEKINKITLAEGPASSKQTIYLLFDYSRDNVEKLRSVNLGLEYNKLYFAEDLLFELE